MPSWVVIEQQIPSKDPSLNRVKVGKSREVFLKFLRSILLKNFQK